MNFERKVIKWIMFLTINVYVRFPSWKRLNPNAERWFDRLPARPHSRKSVKYLSAEHLIALFNMETFTIISNCATAEIKVSPWCSILDSGICYFVFRDKIYDNKNNCSTIQRAAQQKKIQVNRILYNVLESSMEHTLFTVPDNEASNWMLLVVNYAVNEWCANWFMYVQPQNDFMNHRNFWQTLWRMEGHLSNNHRHNNPISSLTN